jgi:hypothetical protein
LVYGEAVKEPTGVKRMTEGSKDSSTRADVCLSADIARFKSDMKRALVLQAIFIVGSIVALVKLLP